MTEAEPCTISGCSEGARQSTWSAFAEQCNIADYDEVERMFGRIKEERGRLDILVNNASIGTAKWQGCT
jgi:NAD(P)-dependent dehydrogenase (short-subunit alcohol dehydrogenase family)